MLETERDRKNKVVSRRGRRKQSGTFISGPLTVQAAQRWADHCNKCWWFEFNFIVKSFNHSIKHSSHRWVTVLLWRLLQLNSGDRTKHVWVGPSLWSCYTHSLLSSLILSFHQAVINPFTPAPSSSLPPSIFTSPSHSTFFLISPRLWSNPINLLLMAVWGTVAVGGLEKMSAPFPECGWKHSLFKMTALLMPSHSILDRGCFFQHSFRNYISCQERSPMGCPH